MFKNKDTSFEIATTMANHLVGETLEKKAENISKFAKAMDYLNAVAEIFDDLGLAIEAEATTILLEKVAGKKTKKKSKKKVSLKKDPEVDNLTPEKMVSNLKHKGWVFNADDGHSKGCMCSKCVDVNDLRHGDDCVCHLCLHNDENEDFDTNKDFSHHIERDDNYADFMDVLNDDDFEDELNSNDHKYRHPVMLPPKHRDTIIPVPKGYDHRGTSNWDYVQEPEITPFNERHFDHADEDAETVPPPGGRFNR